MKKYIEDVRYLINKLEEIHPDLYHNTKKTEIEKIILDLEKKEKEISYFQFIYYIKRILSLFKDPHTKCLNKTKVFPIKLKMINNKVYITNTSKDYDCYKYYEITAINNIPIGKIIFELEKTLSYTTKEWLEASIENELVKKTNINSLPFFNEQSLTHITYTLEKDNDIKELTFNPNETYTYEHIENKIYWMDYDEDNNILIINYKSCKEYDNFTMAEFVKEIEDFIKDHQIEDIIVDIRENSGGNSSIIGPLIDYLENGFNLVTLVDKNVFSSGRFALINMLNLDSKTVGTGIGTKINAFGNCEHFILPNTNLDIICSNTYWYLENGKMCGINKEDLKKHKNQTIFDDEIFTADVYVENSIEDIKIGYDRQLEVAKEILIEQRKKK